MQYTDLFIITRIIKNYAAEFMHFYIYIEDLLYYPHDRNITCIYSARHWDIMGRKHPR